jgi:hypothetical protein
MNSNDDEFKILLGRIGNRGRSESFVNQVLRAMRKAGHEGRGAPRHGGSTSGRGRTVFGRSRFFAGHRRVVVKARVVRHTGRAFRSAPLSAHVA